jgi:hypothetical protein
VKPSSKVATAAAWSLLLWAVWALAAAPLAFWVMLAATTLRAWRQIGVWPAFAYPEANHLRESHAADLVVGLGVLLATAAWGVWMTQRWRWTIRFAIALVAVTILWLGAFALFEVDPGGIVAWNLD